MLFPAFPAAPPPPGPYMAWSMDGPCSLGVERGDERVLEHAVAHRLAQVVVHLAGRREDALDAGRRGRRGEELLHRLGGSTRGRKTAAAGFLSCY